MYKRKLLTCVLGILITLSSCSGNNVSVNITTENSQSPTSTTEAKLDDLPSDLDFEGAEITILSRAHIRSSDDFTVDELYGEIVNDAIYYRQKNVEEHLNVKIVNEKSDEGGGHGAQSIITKVVASGDSKYDIFSGSSYITAPLGINGNFVDLNEVKYLDLTKPYWMQGYIENTQIGKALYSISGDIMLSSIRSAFVVFFNKQLVENYALEDPYKLVREGKWTIDKQAEMLKDIYKDLNGNNEKDAEDFYGLGTSNVIIVDAYTSAFNMHNILFDENHLPYLNKDLSIFAAATEKLHDLNWNQQGVFAYKEIKDNNEMTDLCSYFGQGNLIFINNWLRGTETSDLRNMTSDYGIIPFPKYDEAQENYYTFLHDQFGALGIPITARDPDMVGAVLEALASESRNSVIPAYFDVALKGKYIRDSESAEMLDIIHNGVVLDMSWIYGNDMQGLPQIMRNLLLANKSEYLSTYEKNEGKYEKIIQKMIEKSTVD